MAQRKRIKTNGPSGRTDSPYDKKRNIVYDCSTLNGALSKVFTDEILSREDLGLLVSTTTRRKAIAAKNGTREGWRNGAPLQRAIWNQCVWSRLHTGGYAKTKLVVVCTQYS
jgi:hypothetical protein